MLSLELKFSRDCSHEDYEIVTTLRRIAPGMWLLYHLFQDGDKMVFMKVYFPLL